VAIVVGAKNGARAVLSLYGSDLGLLFAAESEAIATMCQIWHDTWECLVRSTEDRYEGVTLRTLLGNIEQGISVTDENQDVIAFNDGFLELLGLPLNQFRWGVPLASLIRHRAATGEYGEG
jgi:PAS domain-containing protein